MWTGYLHQEQGPAEKVLETSLKSLNDADGKILLLGTGPWGPTPRLDSRPEKKRDWHNSKLGVVQHQFDIQRNFYFKSSIFLSVPPHMGIPFSPKIDVPVGGISNKVSNSCFLADHAKCICSLVVFCQCWNYFCACWGGSTWVTKSLFTPLGTVVFPCSFHIPRGFGT